jgi:pimeloyl-ACP methyl ester carboxylesterase
MIGRLLPLLLAALLLVSHAAKADDATLAPVDCWFPVPAGHAAKCYRLTVPESRTGGSQRLLTLPVAVVAGPGTPHHDDPIVYLTGGPGSAVGLYPDAMAEWWPYIDKVPWLQGRDLVLMDQRGAGLAEPDLDCPEIAAAGLALLKLSGDEPGRRKLYVAAAEACRKRWVAAGYDPGDFDTAAAAADFAALRRALGIGRWNIYSVSYGTRLALTLMRDHPDGLRAVILDSAYPPEEHFFETRRAAIDASFAAVARACAADEACGKAAPDLRRAVIDLVARYDARPVLVPLKDDKTGTTEQIPFTGTLVLEQALSIIDEGDALTDLPALVEGLDKGDPKTLEDTLSGLAEGYLGHGYFSDGKYFAVDCKEEVPFTDDQRREADRLAHPWLENYGLVVDDWYACAGWVGPDARLVSKAPVTSDIPTLVLQGAFDEITPPETGRLAASRLSRGYYREFPEVGHKVVDQSACGQKIAALFLDRPEVPPDDSCLAGKPVRPTW